MEDETGKEQRGLSPRFSVGFEGQNRLLSKQADESKKKKVPRKPENLSPANTLPLH